MKYEQAISLFPLQTVLHLLSSCPLLNSTPFFNGPLSPITAARRRTCEASRRSVENLQEATSSKRNESPLLRNYQLPTVPQYRVKPVDRLPHLHGDVGCFELLLVLWKKPRCCGFEHNGHILSRRQQPRVVLPTLCFLPSFCLLFSKVLGALVMMGDNIEIWLRDGQLVSDSQCFIQLCI